jgi:hypothetical protein
MHVYGSQLAPLLETLVLAGGMDGIATHGTFHARALWRGSLRAWLADPSEESAPDAQIPAGLVPGAPPPVDQGEADMTREPGRASVASAGLPAPAGQLPVGRRSPGWQRRPPRTD